MDYAFHPNVVPHIYARKWGEPRCLDLSQTRDRKGERSLTEHLLAGAHGAFDYHYHIQVDDTEDGFFQLVLLVVMGGQFYLFWHALYNDTTIVCTQAALEALFAEWNDRLFSIPSRVLEQARGFDLAPAVEMGADRVLVRVVQFTKWGGLGAQDLPTAASVPPRIPRPAGADAGCLRLRCHILIRPGRH
mgnify:CR=1 FL=1